MNTINQAEMREKISNSFLLFFVPYFIYTSDKQKSFLKPNPVAEIQSKKGKHLGRPTCKIPVQNRISSRERDA